MQDCVQLTAQNHSLETRFPRIPLEMSWQPSPLSSGPGELSQRKAFWVRDALSWWCAHLTVHKVLGLIPSTELKTGGGGVDA